MDKTTKSSDVNHIAAPSASAAGNADLVQVPFVKDSQSFDGRQAQRLRDIEKHLEAEMKRKRKDWEREVQRMREEFLILHPTDVDRCSDEIQNDPFVAKRRGSTDILDVKKMKTLIVDSLDTGRKFKVRFNVLGFDPRSIQVTTDGDRIVVRATKTETDEEGETVRRSYERKILKPKDADHTKFKSYLTSDAILIVEAPLPPSNHDLRRTIHSPSHSHHVAPNHGGSPSRSCSPSNSVGGPEGGTPSKEKYGVPIFREENGLRRMHLVIEMGIGFSPQDIIVQVIKDNKILVKAKHEEKTTERLSKNKYCKEYELGEKIDTYSLTASLEPDGKLIVGASVKIHGSKKKESAAAAAAAAAEEATASGPEEGGGGGGSKHASPQHIVVAKASDSKGTA